MNRAKLRLAGMYGGLIGAPAGPGVGMGGGGGGGGMAGGYSQGLAEAQRRKAAAEEELRRKRMMAMQAAEAERQRQFEGQMATQGNRADIMREGIRGASNVAGDQIRANASYASTVDNNDTRLAERGMMNAQRLQELGITHQQAKEMGLLEHQWGKEDTMLDAGIAAQAAEMAHKYGMTKQEAMYALQRQNAEFGQQLDQQQFEFERPFQMEDRELDYLTKQDQAFQQSYSQLQQQSKRLNQVGVSRFAEIKRAMWKFDEQLASGKLDHKQYLKARQQLAAQMSQFDWQAEIDPPGTRPGDFMAKDGVQYLIKPEGPQAIGIDPNANWDQLNEKKAARQQWIRDPYTGRAMLQEWRLDSRGGTQTEVIYESEGMDPQAMAAQNAPPIVRAYGGTDGFKEAWKELDATLPRDYDSLGNEVPVSAARKKMEIWQGAQAQGLDPGHIMDYLDEADVATLEREMVNQVKTAYSGGDPMVTIPPDVERILDAQGVQGWMDFGKRMNIGFTPPPHMVRLYAEMRKQKQDGPNSGNHPGMPPGMGQGPPERAMGPPPGMAGPQPGMAPPGFGGEGAPPGFGGGSPRGFGPMPQPGPSPNDPPGMPPGPPPGPQPGPPQPPPSPMGAPPAPYESQLPDDSPNRGPLKVDARDADGNLYKPHEAVVANPQPLDAERVDGQVYGPVTAPDGRQVVAQWDEARNGWVVLKEYPKEKAKEHLAPARREPQGRIRTYEKVMP